MKKLRFVCDAGKPVQLPCGHAWFSCVPSVASWKGRSGSVSRTSGDHRFLPAPVADRDCSTSGRVISITQGRALSSERCDVGAGPKCRRPRLREFRILAYFSEGNLVR
jgi:hypothetical protein